MTKEEEKLEKVNYLANTLNLPFEYINDMSDEDINLIFKMSKEIDDEGKNLLKQTSEITENSEILPLVNNPDQDIIRLNTSDGTEILRFDCNGDIYVKGNLAENDKSVVDGFRDFLKSYGF